MLLGTCRPWKYGFSAFRGIDDKCSKDMTIESGNFIDLYPLLISQITCQCWSNGWQGWHWLPTLVQCWINLGSYIGFMLARLALAANIGPMLAQYWHANISMTGKRTMGQCWANIGNMSPSIGKMVKIWQKISIYVDFFKICPVFLFEETFDNKHFITRELLNWVFHPKCICCLYKSQNNFDITRKMSRFCNTHSL